ncbi:MAG: hypothetical protein MZW92_40685 [Comamonadaceae bacterium]|nr:hypothetical protein [Comamonadaceae bacterium]
MGARRIGLIEVDFTNDHFFAATGTHPLNRELGQIDEEYRRLYRACRDRGVEVFNLSPVSRLTSLPRLSLREFLAAESGAHAAPTAPAPTAPEYPAWPAMAVAIERHNPGIVGDFLDALAASARALGCHVTRDLRLAAERAGAVKIVWNGRDYRGRGPDALLPNTPGCRAGSTRSVRAASTQTRTWRRSPGTAAHCRPRNSTNSTRICSRSAPAGPTATSTCRPRPRPPATCRRNSCWYRCRWNGTPTSSATCRCAFGTCKRWWTKSAVHSRHCR